MTFNHQIKFDPIAHPSAVVYGPRVRFTVLTDRLIRMEYCPAKQGKASLPVFEDRPSMAFWYRNQPVPVFTCRVTDKLIEIETSALLLKYRINRKGFTPASLSIRVKATGKTWSFGDSPQPGENLGGTIRTLDLVFDTVELEPGLISRSGWAVIDDSKSLVFNSDGWLQPRQNPDNLDLYFFGYGQDYLSCLKDFTRIAGKTPLIPRWILGNWWSRYWEYSSDELLALMAEFAEHKIPLSVCVVDMDWHITNTGNDSNGWTGYTWNRELFPNPDVFLNQLHEMGLKVALNLHPAAGIWSHEQQYIDFAKHMGIDPASKEPIPFDCADPVFMQAYFELLHHPQEARGVDFWWLDWQQGSEAKVPGLDPLWWLNHLHFYDLGRDGHKRPLILSRWGGLGNHRYPVGFSGDTVVNWEVLNLLPSFTATAANVGYGWWSHDIGGHMGGIEDDELYTRWVQFGLFSPILRLHCTKNPFHERRPWKRGGGADRAASNALRLRHALVPYLYTMAWRNTTQSLPLILPMYYSHPEIEMAYSVPQQYWYGSELIAAPFTQPADASTRLSQQNVWFPEGDWYDFFTGEHYEGNCCRSIYGTLEDIPVFAKAGAIIPLDDEADFGKLDNPSTLTLRIFPGKDNTFNLYEDDGETCDYLKSIFAITTFSQEWKKNQVVFQIKPVSGDRSIVPAERIYHLEFYSVNQPTRIFCSIDGEPAFFNSNYDGRSKIYTIDGLKLKPNQAVSITLSAPDLLAYPRNAQEKLFKYLNSFVLDTFIKSNIYYCWSEIQSGEAKLDDWELTTSQLKTLSSLLND